MNNWGWAIYTHVYVHSTIYVYFIFYYCFIYHTVYGQTNRSYGEDLELEVLDLEELVDSSELGNVDVTYTAELAEQYDVTASDDFQMSLSSGTIVYNV